MGAVVAGQIGRMTVKITPVLLCGGSGTRLWPLSRKSYPKQFSGFSGADSLFQAAAKRLSGTDFAAPVIMTSSDFRFIVTEQLTGCGVDPGAILIEPEMRNTAPSILAAATYLARKSPDAVILVAPSDHVIGDQAAFHQAIQRALPAVAAGQLVTFGICPDAPETSFGYVQLAASFDAAGGPAAVTGFVEKPASEDAQAMLDAGNYLWNSGMFLFRADAIIAAFDAWAGDLVAPVRQAVDDAVPDLGFLRLDPAAWADCRDISVDYAVMERADNLSVVALDCGWLDLGAWTTIWRQGPQDENGVAVSGAVTVIDCNNSLLRSESDALQLVAIGVENLTVVAMSDAVLVADMSRAQDVRLAVETMVKDGCLQGQEFPRDHRPWGWFETISRADRFQVKRIVVNPGAALSLQSHVHRAEHWIVVQGTARVTVGETVQLVAENQSVYVPLGVRHRLENPGKMPMVLIEVQTGSYLGEDDIERFEDLYFRD